MQWNKVDWITKFPKNEKFLAIYNGCICFASYDDDFEKYYIQDGYYSDSNQNTYANKDEIEYWIRIPSQPERSKREDSHFCEMRCSEHCGNTMRDK